MLDQKDIELELISKDVFTISNIKEFCDILDKQEHVIGDIRVNGRHKIGKKAKRREKRLDLCHFCGKITTSSQMTEHLQKQHNYKRQLMESDLDYFLKERYLTNPLFICKPCNKVFTSQKKYKYHRKITHCKRVSKKVNLYMCVVCKKTFCKPYALKQHERQHSQENPYKCNICSEAFKQRVLLRRHLKSKHDFVESESVPCDICDRAFIHAVALKAHKVRAHRQEKDICKLNE